MPEHGPAPDVPPDAAPGLVVGIGASAGGLEALQEFLRHWSAPGGAALVVVTHAEPRGGPLLAEVLAPVASVPVVVVREPTPLRPGHLYIADPGTLAAVEDGVLHPRRARSARQRRASIDAFFRSLAAAARDRAVGVVLSGAGTDGALGLREIREAGGLTIAQEPGGARFDGMPQHAIASGVVDHVLPPARIPAELAAHVRHLAGRDGTGDDPVQDDIRHALERIAELLHQETDHNFKHYKRSTVVRRVQRRMHVLRLSSAERYVEHLSTSRAERQALYRELLIGVTSFFRDPAAWDAVAAEAIPRILEGHRGETVRAWVPGCATGEEAYTLAILFREALDGVENPPQVQIFATDINERAVAHARTGLYGQGIAQQLSRERLERFFVRQGGRYRVAKEVRELCLFSVHNLISDPPFSRLDLVSCRNVLIYLGPHLQKKLVPVFHYALGQGGFLFLGPSENLGRQTELFRSVSARHRLWQRRQTVIPSPRETPVPGRMGRPQLEPRPDQVDLGQVAQRIVLDEFAPAYAICGEDSQVVYLSSGAGRYLEPPVGHFQSNILKMARTGLRVGLRAALREAVRERRRAVYEGLSVRTEVGVQPVMLTVQPMPGLGEDADLFMVVFQDAGLPHARAPRPADRARSAVDSEAFIEQLERELSTTRHDLETTVQELEAANEELKSSNEELLSMNEELQSANEELETSKEEVQLSNRALERANTDLSNLLSSTRIATLFLDDRGTLRDFTPAVAEIYNLIRADIGRPLAHTTHRLVDPPPLPTLGELLAAGGVMSSEVCSDDGRWYIRRVLPYQNGGALSGLVVTFVDVTRLKEVERDLAGSEETVRRQLAEIEAVYHSAPVGLCVLDTQLRYVRINERLAEINGIPAAEHIGRTVHQIVPQLASQTGPAMRHVLETGEPVVGLEITGETAAQPGAQRSWLVHWYPLRDADDAVIGINVVAEEITEIKRVEAELRASRTALERQLRLTKTITDNASHALVLMGPDGRSIFWNPALEAMTGYSGEEIRANVLHNLIHHTHPDGTPFPLSDCPIDRALPEGLHVRDYEDVFIRKDGTFFPVLCAATPIYENGVAVSTVIEVRDLSERKALDAQLRESEQRFRALQETTPDGFMLFRTVRDDAGVIQDFEWLYVNPSSEAIVGRPAAELVGRRLLEEMPGNRDEGLFDAYVQVVETGEVWQREFSYRHEGLDHWFRTTAARAGDGIAVSFADVTERHRAAAERERLLDQVQRERTLLGQIFENSPAVMALYRGPEQVVTLVNPTWERTVGKLGAIGRPFREVFPEFRDTGLFEVLDHAYQTGEPYVNPEVGVPLERWGSGVTEETYWSLLYLPLPPDADTGERDILVYAIETTPQVAARRAVESASRARTDFMAVMSHELRTPLNAILGYADLIKLGVPVPVPDASLTYVERIRLSADHLLQLIEEVLTFSRLESGREVPLLQRVELERLVQEVTAIVEPLADKRGLQFRCRLDGAPETLVSDGRKLRQILLNLLANAVKFTREGSVELAAEVVGDELHLAVTDTGPGVAPADVPRLFEPFWQGDSSLTRGAGGTGLGLSIAREFARMLGGEIEVRTEVGEGSTFTVRIPFNPSAEPPILRD